MWIERLMAGISHQHVLSYNPKLSYKNSRPYFNGVQDGYFLFGNEPKSELARDLGDCIQSSECGVGTSDDYVYRSKSQRLIML